MPIPPVSLLAAAILSAPPVLLRSEPAAQFHSQRDDSSPNVVRMRPVQVDRELLETAEAIDLVLFEDVVLSARRLRLERRGPDRFTWFGELVGTEGRAILTVEGPRVAGTIELGERRFTIGSLGGAAQALRELGPPALALGADAIAVPPPAAGLEGRAVGADDGSSIDVMVVYTDWALNGDPDIEVAIQNGIDLMNQSLLDSAVATRVRLVAIHRVPGYVEAVEQGADLLRLRNVDGIIDEVHAWRDECQADFVALITEGTSPGGMAFVMTAATLGPAFAPSAFSVTSRKYIPFHVFAHEMGHNLGVHHNWENTSAIGVFNYSKGYFDGVTRFRTIMSGDCPGGCAPIGQYSNPDLRYGGAPTGRPLGQWHEANAALSLNQTRAISAQFRDSTLGCCLADAFEAGDACSSGVTALQPGEVQSRNFCEGTEDWLQFRACAGRTYVLETLNLGTLADTVLEVYAKDCTTLLASDDDGAGNRASRILFTPARAGDYRVRIRQKTGNSGSGKSYDVTLTGDGSACDVCGDGLCEGAVGEGCATCVVDCPPCAPALPLWLAKGVGSELRIQVENVANETGYTVYDGFVPQMWNGGVRRSCVPLWQDLGVRAELSLTVPFKSRWFVVAAANAAGESSCGLDDLGQELNQRPNWPLTAPCP